MSDSKRNQDEEATIAKLLRSAGRGPTASAEARSRIYSSVRAEWRQSLAGNEHRPKGSVIPAQPDRGWLSALFTRGLPAAAMLGLAVVAFYVVRSPEPEAGVELATVLKALGPVASAGRDSGNSAVIAAGDRVVAGQALSTGVQGGASLALRNGISLRMSSETEVLLVAGDAIDVRRGSVYLDTAPGLDPGGAFRVVTPFGDVWHRGTQYEVRVADNLRVRVREGGVGIRAGASEFSGSAGEQLVLVREGGQPLRTTIPVSGPEWAWIENLATAPAGDQHLVVDLLEWVARETGRMLVFETPEQAELAESRMLYGAGQFTPAETLEVIQSTTALRYELTEESLRIY
jgi:hypothetical protein